jgi:hypothetical protein
LRSADTELLTRNKLNLANMALAPTHVQVVDKLAEAVVAGLSEAVSSAVRSAAIESLKIGKHPF